MDKNIKNILIDLYKLDPGLKDYEVDLIKIINKVLVLRPDTKFDNQFKEELKLQLMKKITKINNQPVIIKKLINNFTLMNKLSYSLVGILMVMIVGVSGWYLYGNSISTKINSPIINLSSGINIKPMNQKAFGDFNISIDGFKTTETQGLGGGVRTQAGGGGGLVTDSVIAPMPEFYQPTVYTFSYVGDDLNIDQSQMSVLRRIKNSNAGSQFATTIKGINFGLINLSSFSNAKVHNITMLEDKSEGYILYLNFDEEMLSINQNPEKWQTEEQLLCARSSSPCVLPQPLKINELPSDKDLIVAASSFLNDYNIDMSAYGEPEVDYGWQRWYDAKINSYVPDVLSVKYPLMIDGQSVYDEGGSIYGLIVNVNARSKKTIGFWGYNSNNYQSSAYDIEQDFSKLLGYAEKGGLRGIYASSDAKVVNMELDTPSIHLVRMYNYDIQTGVNDELLAPSLIFPIVKIPEGERYYQDNIIVPLVKDILNKYSGTQIISPIIEPMPLLDT